jgi:hypothetical protein
MALHAARPRFFYSPSHPEADSRRDFAAIVFDLKNRPKLIPAFSALIAWMLSRWIPGLQFAPRPMSFIGMGLVTIPLLLLSLICWQAHPRRHAESDSRQRRTKTRFRTPISRSFRFRRE